MSCCLSGDESSHAGGKRESQLPKVQGMYHMEYSLLGSDQEMGAKTDLVHYGQMAKIFTERQDPKILRSWTDAHQSWVTWSNTCV